MKAASEVKLLVEGKLVEMDQSSLAEARWIMWATGDDVSCGENCSWNVRGHPPEEEQIVLSTCSFIVLDLIGGARVHLVKIYQTYMVFAPNLKTVTLPV